VKTDVSTSIYIQPKTISYWSLFTIMIIIIYDYNFSSVIINDYIAIDLKYIYSLKSYTIKILYDYKIHHTVIIYD